MKPILSLIISYAVIINPACKSRQSSGNALKDLPTSPSAFEKIFAEDDTNGQDIGRSVNSMFQDIMKGTGYKSFIVVADKNNPTSRRKATPMEISGETKLLPSEGLFYGTLHSRYLIGTSLPRFTTAKKDIVVIPIKRYDTAQFQDNDFEITSVGGTTIRISLNSNAKSLSDQISLNGEKLRSFIRSAKLSEELLEKREDLIMRPANIVSTIVVLLLFGLVVGLVPGSRAFWAQVHSSFRLLIAGVFLLILLLIWKVKTHDEMRPELDRLEREIQIHTQRYSRDI